MKPEYVLFISGSTIFVIISRARNNNSTGKFANNPKKIAEQCIQSKKLKATLEGSKSDHASINHRKYHNTS